MAIILQIGALGLADMALLRHNGGGLGHNLDGLHQHISRISMATDNRVMNVWMIDLYPQ